MSNTVATQSVNVDAETKRLRVRLAFGIALYTIYWAATVTITVLFYTEALSGSHGVSLLLWGILSICFVTVARFYSPLSNYKSGLSAIGQR